METDTQDHGHVKWEAETGVMQSQTRDSRGLRVPSGWRGKETNPLEASESVTLLTS